MDRQDQIERILAILRRRPRGATVTAIAAAIRLSEGTARTLLLHLQEQGDVVRTPEQAGTRGRPRYLWRKA